MAEALGSLEAVLTLQEKFNNSLQPTSKPASRTIFDRLFGGKRLYNLVLGYQTYQFQKTHAENSPYLAGWKAYDENPYHEKDNPSGVIQMGLAENQDTWKQTKKQQVWDGGSSSYKLLEVNHMVGLEGRRSSGCVLI
ncbi:pyridoxal phosphate-dependent transferase [Artemisia annua]|uniref:Pyridoxal phosphate-dependent transferase n=1 Tax=Artemisia annua TaxID=35608 RepID=A0A2U1QII4_ARTAN|nr:pyridoxal phosphate-dependent transferase [Artemisia annua]